MAKDKFHGTTAICGPALAYKRVQEQDSSGHASHVARDTPLGYPKGLADEKTETR
jgi:hypothetical protein